MSGFQTHRYRVSLPVVERASIRPLYPPAARESRTPDLLITNQPLYLLSYGGTVKEIPGRLLKTSPSSGAHLPGSFETRTAGDLTATSARGEDGFA